MASLCAVHVPAGPRGHDPMATAAHNTQRMQSVSCHMYGDSNSLHNTTANASYAIARYYNFLAKFYGNYERLLAAWRFAPYLFTP
eukprot:g61779.t1